MENRLKSKSVLNTQEGKILLAGFVLFYIFLAVLAYSFFKSPVLGRTLLGAFVAHTLGGRAAGVGLCIAFQINVPVTILYNMFLEVLIVLFSYSLFLLSFNHYFKIKFISRALKNAEKNAHKYEDVISRYGWLGIFIFVMIPLPVTGPVVGAIIAYFLKFDLKRNFLIVFSGTFAAIILWTIFFDFLSDHITKIQGVLAIVVIILILSFYKHIKDWFSGSG